MRVWELSKAVKDTLRDVLNDTSTHTVRIADDEGDLKIKVNEYTWSPPLQTAE